MKNPFMDFRSVHYQKKEIPLDRIVREKQEIMDRILESHPIKMDKHIPLHRVIIISQSDQRECIGNIYGMNDHPQAPI